MLHRGKIFVTGGEGSNRVFGSGGPIMGGNVQSAVHEAFTLG